ncbi:MAG: TIGR04076 family protein [Chloroflexi bacterium]|nr:TIGR04076 family protein [Chloroflexota bacterium]
MSEEFGSKLVARVVSQKGTCSAGHKVGDEFMISNTTREGMCAWAYYALFPFASALMYGGKFPWESDPNRCTVACPDPANPVVFELIRKV